MEYTYISELDAEADTLKTKFDPIVSDECIYLCNLALNVNQFTTFCDFCRNLHEFGTAEPTLSKPISSGESSEKCISIPTTRFGKTNAGTQCKIYFYIGKELKTQLSELNSDGKKSIEEKRAEVAKLLDRHKVIPSLKLLFNIPTNLELDLVVKQICDKYIDMNVDSLHVDLDFGIERLLSEKLIERSPFEPAVSVLDENGLRELYKQRQDHLVHFLKSARLITRAYKHLDKASPEKKGVLIKLLKEHDYSDAYKHLGEKNVHQWVYDFSRIAFDMRKLCANRRFECLRITACMLETPVGDKDGDTFLEIVQQVIQSWNSIVQV